MARVDGKPDPIELAARSLRHRDRSRQEIDARLEKAGVGEEERIDALETLERVGYVDDERFARTRAETLAGRGLGDEAIRADLEERGVDGAAREAALGGLTPEAERAKELVARLGRTQQTAARLARKGFSVDSLESALGELAAGGGP